MGIGYCLMYVHNLATLYVAMTIIIVGNGFFKPNISTLLGNVYSAKQYEKQKDDGYNIFYMGINIGAFICNFISAWLYTKYGWGEAFLSAGIGMFLGVIIFTSGTKHYKAYDIKKGLGENDMSMSRIVMLILAPSVIAGIIGWLFPGNLLGSDSTDAFIFACIPVIYFYLSLYFKAKSDEKKPIAALLAIFTVVILFWAVFKQNGSALNTWADRYTDRSLNGPVGAVFLKLKQAQPVAYKKDSVAVYDEQFRLKKENGTVIKEYNYPTYFRNMAETDRPADGNEVSLWATNLSQSINPGWVIILTPLIITFFTWLRRKKKEPSTATKITFGLFISALSALVMVAAVYASNNGTEKASVFWLIGSYGVITIGELLLSPMGLSLVSKLSPVRITSLMMGGWFLSTSIGNKLSGVLATMWDNYNNKANYFFLNFILLMAAAIACFIMLRWLNKIMKEKGVQ